MQFSAADMDSILAAVGTDALLDSAGIRVKFRPNSINELGILTDRPQIIVKTSDLDGVNFKTATLTVNGETFRMIKPLPGADGFATVGLTRA